MTGVRNGRHLDRRWFFFVFILLFPRNRTNSN
jgi:hypothetical protein